MQAISASKDRPIIQIWYEGQKRVWNTFLAECKCILTQNVLHSTKILFFLNNLSGMKGECAVLHLRAWFLCIFAYLYISWWCVVILYETIKWKQIISAPCPYVHLSECLFSSTIELFEPNLQGCSPLAVGSRSFSFILKYPSLAYLWTPLFSYHLRLTDLIPLYLLSFLFYGLSNYFS